MCRFLPRETNFSSVSPLRLGNKLYSRIINKLIDYKISFKEIYKNANNCDIKYTNKATQIYYTKPPRVSIFSPSEGQITLHCTDPWFFLQQGILQGHFCFMMCVQVDPTRVKVGPRI